MIKLAFQNVLLTHHAHVRLYEIVIFVSIAKTRPAPHPPKSMRSLIHLRSLRATEIPNVESCYLLKKVFAHGDVSLDQGAVRSWWAFPWWTLPYPVKQLFSALNLTRRETAWRSPEGPPDRFRGQTPTQSKNCKKYIGCFSTSLIGRFLPTESLKGRSTRECSEFRPKRSMSINAVILILGLYSCFAPRELLEDPFDFLIKIFFQNREHLINISEIPLPWIIAVFIRLSGFRFQGYWYSIFLIYTLIRAPPCDLVTYA